MKCYSLVIEPRLVKQIDELIKKHGLYNSRSDFIRDAIRQRLIEVKKLLGERTVEEKRQREVEKREAKEAELLEKALDEFKYRGVH